jgi:D-beta-D-heptose 7-phosphate kinase/D-beta-D-heptose 1-phosphate adenosyltransferase
LLNLNNIVDYVVIFNEDTPYNILKHIQPNVIVKGGDYKKEDVIGGEFANEILLFDYINNKSTTLTIKKINNYVK